MKTLQFTSFLILLGSTAFAQAKLSFALPERLRLLEDQRVDLVIEARNATPSSIAVTANGTDITGKFKGPVAADLDCDATTDFVYRADLMSFPTAGWVRIVATVQTDQGQLQTIQDIPVQPFSKPQKKNAILFVGDGMTQTWVDAGRIVSRSTETIPGVGGLRQGFFDRLLEMDRLPASGSIMTIGQDKIIPDSAPTANALATGNKTFDGAIGTFEDGTDCATGSGTTATTAKYSLDNPRIENIAEYLKRRFGYRIGIVTTSNLPDATPSAFGSHTADRNMGFEIISQYLNNPLLGGPSADVFMGGGGESFNPAVRPDKQDIIGAFKARDYSVVRTATDLKAVNSNTTKLLGIFKEVNATPNSAGIGPSSSSAMNVAYDKLRLKRPGSEPLANFNGWEDQPFLDLMTQKAIEVLAGPDGDQPFFLMVEAASIDKQSHSGHAAGATWDVIELDKAVGASRAWAAQRKQNDTLIVVTADHGHPMLIIGAAPISDTDYFDRTGFSASMSSPLGTLTTTIYKDVNHNTRAAIPYGSVGGKTGPPAVQNIDVYGTFGFPNYVDADGDGYPENVATDNGKGTFRLAYGFRTGSHTSLTLPVMAQGPGALLFTGIFDQTEIPLKIAAALANNTDDVDKALDKLVYSPEFPKTPGK